MKTLSDNLDVNVSTGGMAAGYITTKIYANGIGVFTGRTYIDGNGSDITVNVNDIAALNHGKIDYLKLNNGSVESMPLVDDMLGTYSYYRRWNRGLIGEYKVDINGPSSSDPEQTTNHNNSVIALAGYDYVNKNLKPLFTDDPRYPNDTSLARIMQGCDWRDIPEDEIGEFSNLLLPHYPHKYTAKYGFGLQVYAGTPPTSMPNQDYSLRRDIGSSATKELQLGSPIYGYSNTTFVSLFTLVSRISQSANSDYDVSVYIKRTGSSGDEFGDWEIGREWFRGRLNISGIRVTGSEDGQIVYDETFNEGETFRVYMRRYIGTIGADWDLNKIMAGDREVYRTDWKGSQQLASYDMDVYEDNYGTIEIAKSAPQEFQYDHLYAEPVYEEIIDNRYDPDIYHGTCPVAILDGCYARYYLAWNDRYGDIQSQAFEGKIEFSESFDKSEMMDYKMKRRVIHNEVQPKWKLNTKWLPEDIYSMYESIFTSPYLLLYDTETDRSWNVIVTDSEYKEKTFKTEKKLFNLELNIEANKVQNNIY